MNNKKGDSLSIGIVVELALGTVFGILTDNIGIGVGIGLAIGIAMGSSSGNNN